MTDLRSLRHRVYHEMPPGELRTELLVGLGDVQERLNPLEPLVMTLQNYRMVDGRWEHA